jgi:hypothetical protein
MDLHIEIESQKGLLLVTASGSVAFDATFRLLKQVCDMAWRNELTKFS